MQEAEKKRKRLNSVLNSKEAKLKDQAKELAAKAKILERREQSLVMSKKKMKTTPNCDSAIAMTKPQENVLPQASNSADTSTLINLLANKEDHARYQDEKWMENSRVSKTKQQYLFSCRLWVQTLKRKQIH